MVFAKKALLACVASMSVVPGIASAAETELIEASALLNSGMSNGLNEFGQVANALLDENSKSLEYVFFETSDTFTPTSDEQGFVAIDNVDFAPGSLGEWQVIVEDTNSQRKPQELEVTRTEAEYRLLSRVLNESISFSDAETRSIDDILINPDTGGIEYFTVSMDAESFFNDDIRVIPASEVEVARTGQVTASVPLSEVESGSEYQWRLN